MARWKLHQLPARVATGAFILSSGLDKRAPDDQTVQGLYGFATSTAAAGVALTGFSAASSGST